jgi:predicted anti-sigma-YlaC factor YlaD
VKCEETRQFLPDHVLGTLSETESAAVRRHLRACSSCRGEAAELDEGVALFAGAAHATEPPPELRDRVMAVLEEEWAEVPDRPSKARRHFAVGWQAVAALLLVLAGLAAWAGMAQGNANRFRDDASNYRAFLGALGGKDVRVGQLEPTGGMTLEGSAVMYDSDRGQSWLLVLARAPGYAESVTVKLEGPGHTIELPFPMKFDPDGEGSAWLVTSADISRFDQVVLTDARGQVIGQAHVRSGELGI